MASCNRKSTVVLADIDIETQQNRLPNQPEALKNVTMDTSMLSRNCCSMEAELLVSHFEPVQAMPFRILAFVLIAFT